MKKFLLFMSLMLLGASFVCAEDAKLFPYKGTAINDVSNGVKIDGCNEYVSIPAKNPFTLTGAFLGTTTASAILIPMLLDPYVIEIDGNKYVLVKDRKDNKWTEKDLLGYEDPKTNRFQSLIGLNSDGDHSKITPAELRKANIRFVRMDKKGALLVNDRKKDYNLNKIDYIDIINLKRTANAESTGIFGHFTVYLKTNNVAKRAVVGYVTFETNEKIQILFK